MTTLLLAPVVFPAVASGQAAPGGSPPAQKAEPELLGVIENTPSAYSMLMFVRLRVEADGEKRNLPRLCALTALRVNQRLLYVYTYRIFKSSADAEALEKFTRDWIAQIVAANPGDSDGAGPNP